MKLGLDPNEGRRECEMCEWCNWALSKRRKHEFWKIEFCPRKWNDTRLGIQMGHTCSPNFNVNKESWLSVGSKALKDIGSTCLFDQLPFQGHLR